MAMWLIWATLDIFSHGIFIVYLKFVSGKFGIPKKNRHFRGRFWGVLLFDSVFSSLYRPLIYMDLQAGTC